MPVVVRKIGNLYRVVEKATGRISETKKGKPVDGGGHSSEKEAQSQCNAINAAHYNPGWKPTRNK